MNPQDAPKEVHIKQTTGYAHNWWGVVTDPVDDDGVAYVRADLVPVPAPAVPDAKPVAWVERLALDALMSKEADDRLVCKAWSYKATSSAVPLYAHPASAVPDDVAAIAETLRRATFTRGRMHCGIIGQTIEAAMRSTFHEVSAWDLIAAADALEAQAAALTQPTGDTGA